MKKEILDKVRKNVPSFIFDSLYEDYVVDAIGKIREECVKDNKDKVRDVEYKISKSIIYYILSRN